MTPKSLPSSRLPLASALPCSLGLTIFPRPQTAYFLWLADNREAIKKANPDAKGVAEIGKLAGEGWGKASAAERKKYEDAAAKDKERYTKEMAAYKK